MLNVIQRWHP